MAYNIDNNDLNADWVKARTWDLPYQDLAGFFESQGLTDGKVSDQVAKLKHFMTLPTYIPAPATFKAQAIRFITVNE